MLIVQTDPTIADSPSGSTHPTEGKLAPKCVTPITGSTSSLRKFSSPVLTADTSVTGLLGEWFRQWQPKLRVEQYGSEDVCQQRCHLRDERCQDLRTQ